MPIKLKKTCPSCKKTKERKDFYIRQDRYIGSYCKSCHIKYGKKYRKSSKYKASQLKTQYDATKEEIDRFIEDCTKQEYCCAICGNFDETYKSPYRLVYDHDHKMGRYRGAICAKCNVGLGSFMDNPSLLHQAATYLLGEQDYAI